MDHRSQRITAYTRMFDAYGQEATASRIAFYEEAIGEVEPALLEEAVKKAALESKNFPPGPGTIAKHLRETVYTPHGYTERPRSLEDGERGQLYELPTALSELEKRAGPPLRKLLEKAQEIRVAGKTKPGFWGQIASYMLAAEVLRLPYPLDKQVREKAMREGVR